MGPLKANAGFLQREQTTTLVLVTKRRAFASKPIKPTLPPVDSLILAFLLNNVSAGDRVSAENLL